MRILVIITSIFLVFNEVYTENNANSLTDEQNYPPYLTFFYIGPKNRLNEDCEQPLADSIWVLSKCYLNSFFNGAQVSREKYIRTVNMLYKLQNIKGDSIRTFMEIIFYNEKCEEQYVIAVNSCEQVKYFLKEVKIILPGFRPSSFWLNNLKECGIIIK